MAVVTENQVSKMRHDSVQKALNFKQSRLYNQKLIPRQTSKCGLSEDFLLSCTYIVDIMRSKEFVFILATCYDIMLSSLTFFDLN